MILVHLSILGASCDLVDWLLRPLTDVSVKLALKPRYFPLIVGDSPAINFQPCLAESPIQEYVLSVALPIARNHGSALLAVIHGANQTEIAKHYPDFYAFVNDAMPPFARLVLSDKGLRSNLVDCLIGALKNPTLPSVIQNEHVIHDLQARTTIFEIDPQVNWAKDAFPAFVDLPAVKKSLHDAVDSIENTTLIERMQHVDKFDDFKALPWTDWSVQLKKPIKGLLSTLVGTTEGEDLIVEFTKDLINKTDGIIDLPMIPASIRTLIKIFAMPLQQKPLPQTIIDAESQILHEYSGILTSLIYARPAPNASSLWEYLNSTAVYVMTTVFEKPELRTKMLNATLNVLYQVPIFSTFGQRNMTVLDPALATLSSIFLKDRHWRHLAACIDALGDSNYFSRLKDMDHHEAIDEFLWRLNDTLPTMVFDPDIEKRVINEYESRMPEPLFAAFSWAAIIFPPGVKDDVTSLMKHHHNALSGYRTSKKHDAALRKFVNTQAAAKLYPIFRYHAGTLAQLVIDVVVGVLLLGITDQDPKYYAQDLRFVLKDDVTDVLYNLRNPIYYMYKHGFQPVVDRAAEELKRVAPSMRAKVLQLHLDHPSVAASAIIKILRGPFPRRAINILGGQNDYVEAGRIVVELLEIKNADILAEALLQHVLQSMQENPNERPLIDAGNLFDLLDIIIDDAKGRTLVVDLIAWFSSCASGDMPQVVNDLFGPLQVALRSPTIRRMMVDVLHTASTTGLFDNRRFNFARSFKSLQLPLADLVEGLAEYPFALEPVGRILFPVLLYDDGVAQEVADAPKWPCLVNFLRGSHNDDLSAVDVKAIVTRLKMEKSTSKFALGMLTSPHCFDAVWALLRGDCLKSEKFAAMVSSLPRGYIVLNTYGALRELLSPTHSRQVQDKARTVYYEIVTPLREKLLTPRKHPNHLLWWRKKSIPKLPAPRDFPLSLIRDNLGRPQEDSVRAFFVSMTTDGDSLAAEKSIADFLLNADALGAIRDGVPQNVQQYVTILKLIMSEPNLKTILQSVAKDFLTQKSLQTSIGVLLASFTGFVKYSPQEALRRYFSKVGLTFLSSLLNAHDANSVFWGIVDFIQSPDFAKTWKRAVSEEDMELVNLGVAMFRNSTFDAYFADFLNATQYEGIKINLWKHMEEAPDMRAYSGDLIRVLNKTLPQFVNKSLTLPVSKVVWERIIFQRFLFDYDFVRHAVYPHCPDDAKKVVQVLSWALYVHRMARDIREEFVKILERDPILVISLALTDETRLIRHIVTEVRQDLHAMFKAYFWHHNRFPDLIDIHTDVSPSPKGGDDPSKPSWKCYWLLARMLRSEKCPRPEEHSKIMRIALHNSTLRTSLTAEGSEAEMTDGVVAYVEKKQKNVRQTFLRLTKNGQSILRAHTD
eukprot:GEMP01000920.1.p1 GENE.GEMP01000920.1~~GEMP01000920.1.p1  ORF type:complete len:1387 (+),score=337.66 GEMP01000920.1:284-4444(+)